MKKIKLYLLNFVILPLVLVLSTELVERGSFVSALNWPFLYPAEFFVSCLLVLGLLSIFMAVTNNQEISFFVVLTISLLFALVSNTKQKFLGEPLLPYDFILSKETTDIINYFSSFINTKIILFLGLLVLLGVVLFRYLPLNKHRVKYSVLERIVLLLLSLIIFSSISSGSPLPLKEKFALQSITWDQKLNSSRNGLLLSFLTNLQWLSVEQPVDYNQGRITHIVNKSTGTDGAIPATGSPAVKPNIIIVMNEAFWDPGLLPGISFNQDPLPFFHSLQNKHSAGSLLVPVFGGGTVNTEFEVLTGHSTHFLPGGSIAYAQYVRKPVESLASILTGQGYTATAIHSYHNWFYRRDQVFRNFGFAKFISGEFFVEPELKRYYISDREVSRLIIEESQKTTGPFFVFAVTMQNHGPYVIGYGDQAKI
ncbi:MAG: sulfatase-like hydrolase/transferase, partial [Clostridia bacterium]|nr:sulfatase-like hydrolase/transferase [Clostridia bacterium]